VKGCAAPYNKKKECEKKREKNCNKSSLNGGQKTHSPNDATLDQIRTLAQKGNLILVIF
jgi:hypothetical protein